MQLKPPLILVLCLMINQIWLSFSIFCTVGPPPDAAYKNVARSFLQRQGQLCGLSVQDQINDLVATYSTNQDFQPFS
ncbi:hypothetical protein A9R01_00295, partial ['Osedax' symbiont bacterium Rs2_46_30_T18]